jgi:DNA-binding response OmpR family regulator
MAKGERVLVVDDEIRYIRAIEINLKASGYEVLSAMDGEGAIELTATEEPDLVLLDLRLPDMDGREVCRRIREFSSVPVIMVTALAENMTMVEGLDTGADDYITKPFSAIELLARVRAVLRRVEMSQRQEETATFETPGLRVDFAQKRVFCEDREVHLTNVEYRLLRALVRDAGKVLVPEYLLGEVWGIGYEGDDHLVWQAIHRLRQKIEPDPKQPRYIHTRPGLGYVFDPLPAAQ